VPGKAISATSGVTSRRSSSASDSSLAPPDVFSTDGFQKIQRHWAWAALLMSLVLVAYLPSLAGGFIWDDDVYLVNNLLIRDWAGLKTIWTDLDSVPQWYPMVFTTFALEYPLFGTSPGGYRLVNVLLHGVSSVLLWRFLLRLNLPIALPAALVWGLHPVQVESVAWITERKNTLSAVFYLLALHALWSALDDRRRGLWLAAAMLAFAAALLSKSVTASLPAVFWVLCWWHRRSLPRSVLLVTILMLMVGAASGLLTAWLEREHVGAMGGEWDYHPTFAGEWLHRTLIASRCLLFYVGSIVWPADLMFIYPRFEISILDVRDYLPLLSCLALAIVAAALAFRGDRGPMALLMIFCGTLFPAIGFLNVWPHRYSFVADHFQYLASAALVAGLMMLMWRALRSAFLGVASSLALVLAGLTMWQTTIYADAITLWSDTVRRNPTSWMAMLNLGHALRETGRAEDRAAANDLYERAFLIHQNADTRLNVASLRGVAGDLATAEQLYRAAAEERPGFLAAEVGLANVMLLTDRPREAEAILRASLENPLSRRDPEPWRRLGEALLRQGDAKAAVEPYEKATHLSGARSDLLIELAAVLLETGDAGHRRRSIDLMLAAVNQPRADPRAWVILGYGLTAEGDRSGAMMALETALRLRPGQADVAARLEALRQSP
jgi:protein O-mannosyl-transferase